VKGARKALHECIQLAHGVGRNWQLCAHLRAPVPAGGSGDVKKIAQPVRKACPCGRSSPHQARVSVPLAFAVSQSRPRDPTTSNRRKPGRLIPLIIDLSPPISDFADTAAAIAQLDLIVMTDSAVAHLAGSMGKPVWLLLGHRAHWLWLLDRTDNPWYPSMRQDRPSYVGQSGAVHGWPASAHGFVASTPVSCVVARSSRTNSFWIMVGSRSRRESSQTSRCGFGTALGRTQRPARA
jgi:hypothetical protein